MPIERMVTMMSPGTGAEVRLTAPRRTLSLSALRRTPATIAVVAASLLVLAGCGGTAHDPAPETPHAFAAPASAGPSPKATTFETVEVSTSIPFERTTVDDPERDAGVTEIVTPGALGTKVSTYRVTRVDGVEAARTLVSETVTVAPVTEVTAHGTREPPAAAPAPFVAADPAAQCDPNYADACVPIASDVDCAGGKGNGPAYVQGPVRVVGTDIYDLDRDGDGIGCDK